MDRFHYLVRNATAVALAGQGLRLMPGRGLEDMAYTPSMWPVMGRLTGGFGERTDPFSGEGNFHAGVDISSYYGDEQVAALVTFKIDTKGSDQVAQKIASFPNIEDVFLVTGDTDIIAKARFPNYAALKKFIVDDVAEIDGVKETRTFMVVTTFKERGEVRLETDEEAKK